MADKYGASVLLLNGQAVCYLQMGRYEEAEGVLQEALDKVKYVNISQKLVNAIFRRVCGNNLLKFM